MATNNLNMGITAFPVDPPSPKPEPVKEEPTDIPPKLLAIMKKYKYNWRLDQLSKMPEFKRVKKYIAPPVEMIKPTPKKEVILDKEVEFRCDHLSRPNLRFLTETRRQHRKRGKRFRQQMKKNINRTWHSIYNYYKLLARKKERARKLVKPGDSKKKARSRKSIEKERQERRDKLATPKKIFGPPPAPKKNFKPLEELKERVDLLATPKVRLEMKEKKLGVVKPEALTYEITPPIQKLASTIPKRYMEKPEIIIPGQVKKSALKAKITDRLNNLALPKVRREQKQTIDDESDPWAISPNALKYKATPRILELAKPIERD